VEIEDPAVRLMLGRPHRLRVRVKITVASLPFEDGADWQSAAAVPSGEVADAGAVIATPSSDSPPR